MPTYIEPPVKRAWYVPLVSLPRNVECVHRSSTAVDPRALFPGICLPSSGPSILADFSRSLVGSVSVASNEAWKTSGGRGRLQESRRNRSLPSTETQGGRTPPIFRKQTTNNSERHDKQDARDAGVSRSNPVGGVSGSIHSIPTFLPKPASRSTRASISREPRCVMRPTDTIQGPSRRRRACQEGRPQESSHETRTFIRTATRPRCPRDIVVEPSSFSI